MKKYKTCSPENTILRIRQILNDLGILLYERHKLHSKFYSCRVSLGNKGLIPLNIGTNGKGRSFEYSLASGYAEFMERLQNNLLLNAQKMLTEKTYNAFSLISEYKNNHIVYSCDETHMALDDIDSSFLSDLCRMTTFEDKDDLLTFAKEIKHDFVPVVVPFYDVQKKKSVLLPVELLLLLTGSNGMASGNSPKEAMLQAFCEIFERYVISEIYWKEITPPTIDLSLFDNTTIGGTLKEYQRKTGNKVIIKDCSLGLGIPALGIIIINEKECLYNFKLGVDPVPSVALERCFTEVHQGRDVFQGLPFEFINTRNISAEDKEKAEDNLMNIFINGTGFWPISIFKENPSYNFKGFNPALGQTNAYDIQYCINLIKGLGYNVYIRDNSMLGFPTYYIVVPGMSQILKKNPFVSIYKSSFVNLIHVNQLGRINNEYAKILFDAIDENYEILKKNDFELKRVFVFNVDTDINELSFEMLAALLAFYIGDNDACIKYLERYVLGKDKASFLYYYACIDYLKNLNNGNATELIAKLYGKNIADEVVNDLSDRKNIFQYYNMPNCPYCDNCKLANSCKKKDIDNIYDLIRRKEREYNIDQERVGYDIFGDEE
ncbi:MAG: YcaO-like family protein [Prevotella sp.]|nr:YcaO-like family protein [Prevotella sp.]